MKRSQMVRIADANDCQNILYLFNDIFGTNRSEAHWKWKFIDNPVGKLIAAVCEDNGRIIGQCALLPVWMVVNGSKILGAIALDTMVHPNYRKSGLFVEMASMCIEKATSENVKLFYGFPNKNAYPGWIRKLNWWHIGTLPLLLNIINPYPMLKRKTKSDILASILHRPTLFLLKVLQNEKTRINIKGATESRVVILDRFDAQFDVLWEKIRNSYTISLWKDSTYLNWRYIQCPDTNYVVFAVKQNTALNAFLVLKIVEPNLPARPYKTGYIVDFLCLPEKLMDGKLLIASSLQYLRDRNVDMVISQSLEHSLSFISFRQLGFMKHGKGDNVICQHNLYNPDAVDSINLRNWQLMPGDSDLY